LSAGSAAAALAAGRTLVARAPEPWAVLVPLAVAQWAAVAVFALAAEHNGWLYYQGGDQTYYYTTAWLFTDWTFPVAAIGYGWPYLLTPIALFAGSSVLTAMPAVIVFDVLVLLPVALFCVYGIAARIGGRALGYLAAAAWVVAPYVAIPIWDERYHEKYVDLTLPQTFGFSALADFPSMVAVLVAAYFAVRALDTRAWTDAALAGLAAGFAIGIKPANGLFAAAPLVALLIARRWRELASFAAAAAPALAALAVWKERGLGQVPALADGAYPLAAALGAALPLASLADSVTRYLTVDWDALGVNLDLLREFGWSVRVAEWVPLAGLVAVGRRSIPKAALLGVWFFAFLLVKGGSDKARVEDASFFRLLMPSFPAYVLLLALIPLLVPTLGPRLADRFPAAARPLRRSAVVAAAVVFALVPLLLVATARPQSQPVAGRYLEQKVFVPASGELRLSATRTGRSVRLDWEPPAAAAGTIYYLLRSPARYFPVTRLEPPADEGMQCKQGAVLDCIVWMKHRVVTRERSLVDSPPRGRWTYRVAVAANWRDDPAGGDILLLSRPVTVAVP
jgi:hypothetical protein